ncbi:21577_t:CDS:1, partial [Gigaspora rosea]
MSYTQNLDTYIELATQIASLIQQLQVFQTLQANVLFKLNTIPYPKFVEETQDPISWLDKIENTFKANLVQEAHKISIIAAKLKRPAEN